MKIKQTAFAFRILLRHRNYTIEPPRLTSKKVFCCWQATVCSLHFDFFSYLFIFEEGVKEDQLHAIYLDLQSQLVFSFSFFWAEMLTQEMLRKEKKTWVNNLGVHVFMKSEMNCCRGIFLVLFKHVLHVKLQMPKQMTCLQEVFYLRRAFLIYFNCLFFSPCPLTASCVNLVGNFTCRCVVGFYYNGTHCLRKWSAWAVCIHSSYNLRVLSCVAIGQNAIEIVYKQLAEDLSKNRRSYQIDRSSQRRKFIITHAKLAVLSMPVCWKKKPIINTPTPTTE